VPSASAPLDELIARLRARAADPAHRVDVRVSAFTAEASALGLDELSGRLLKARADLTRLVSDIRGDSADPELSAKAERIGEEMARPARPDLPLPADPSAIARAEAQLGHPMPAFLRRLYLEVANGGFGPGGGLMGVEMAVQTYRDLRATPPAPKGCEWPERVLPLIEQSPGYDCVDVSDGTVVAWDPEELEENSSRKRWLRSFKRISPSVEAWLEQWVGAPTFKERMAKQLAGARIQEARRSRARIAAMTPEQRDAMGLPREGWERVVWGGLGLDEAEQ
jgi:hypothetical protein